MKTTNKRSREFVRSLQNFQSSNLSGHWDGELYVVLSYAWYPLFIYDSIGGKWYENQERYSVSTSKQQTQCRPFGEEFELLSLEDMRDIKCRRYESKIMA